jgi:DNA repair protein RecO
MGQTVHDEKVLTVLTEQMGCISVFAKTSRKKTQYDQFYYGEWVLYETAGGNYLLNSFSLEEPFHGLKDRMEDTFLAGYFAQLVLHFCKGEPRDTGVLLSLMLNGLYLLGKGRDALLIKSVFELKTMQLMGYCPNLSPCDHPGAHFALEDGSILCDTCAMPHKTVPVSATVLAAITHILNQPPAKAYSFSIPEGEQVGLSKLTEAFLFYHLELRSSALEMWKEMK